MISDLSYPEFEQRLLRLTYEGDPFMMGSPLKILGINDEEEPFYGWAGKGKFTITNNSFRYPSRSVIEGSYRREEDSKTFVTYEINPIGFAYIFARAWPPLMMIFVIVMVVLAEGGAYGIIIAVIIFSVIWFLHI